MKKILLLVIGLLITNICYAADLSELSPSPATRASLYQIAKWPKDCEDDYTSNKNNMPEDIQNTGGLTIYPLNNNQSLVEVLCFTAAYQSNYYYVFVDKAYSTTKLISFKTFDFDDNQKVISSQESNVAGTPLYKDGLLTLLYKSRGVGDCGSLVTYGFTGHGKSYVVNARAKQCDDNPDSTPQLPEHWPIIEDK